MSSKKRRSSGRVPQEEEIAVKIEGRSRRTTPASATGDTQDSSRAGAARHGARAAAEGNGGNSLGARCGRPQIEVNQAETNAMMQQIKALQDACEYAQDRAADIDVPAQAVQAAVACVVRFLLFRHHEKPGIPVKRQDILDAAMAAACVGKGSRAAKKLPAVVLPLAAAKLATAFGMELKEIKRHTPGEGGPAAAAAGAAGATTVTAAAAGSAAPGTITYKVMSMLPTPLLITCSQKLQGHPERGFMTVVLALLQMKQYKMDTDELWNHLAQLGIDRDDQDAGAALGGVHPTKILEKMEQSRYLVATKQPAPNTEQGSLTVYEWGEVAHAEFGGGVLEDYVNQLLAADRDV